jgi:hypothetical protein
MNSCQDHARPWAIFQCLPGEITEVRARFKKRSDADAYMSILRRSGGIFEVAFDGGNTTPTTDEQVNTIQATN